MRYDDGDVERQKPRSRVRPPDLQPRRLRPPDLHARRLRAGVRPLRGASAEEQEEAAAETAAAAEEELVARGSR